MYSDVSLSQNISSSAVDYFLGLLIVLTDFVKYLPF